MFEGQIAGIVKPEETDMSELGALMLGISFSVVREAKQDFQDLQDLQD